jgi:hypothetical protein
MRLGLQALVTTRSRFGTLAATMSLSDRVMNRVCTKRIVDVIWLESTALNHSIEADPRFEFRFLTADEVAEFSADPSNDLDAGIVRRAKAGRDFCFAAIGDGRLASYGWYAMGCIEAEHNFGVAMSYSANTAYMYKGFTHPDFRGARLHGVGMGRALQSLERYGVTALISTIDWVNFASMKSSLRLGYERLGRVVTFGDHILSCPKAAIAKGVRFGTAAASRTDQHNLLAEVSRGLNHVPEAVAETV